MHLSATHPARSLSRPDGDRQPPESALSSLFEPRPTETLEPDAVLFWEGDRAEDLFQVARGCLRLYRMMSDGRRAVTGFMFPGEILGVSFKDRYLFTAEAITQAKLRRVPRTQLHASLARMPKLGRELLATASDEFSAAQDQMLLLARKTALERIANFLVIVARRTGATREAEEIELPMSRLDIADFLGLTIETVCRVLTKLKTEGLIALPSPHRVGLIELAQLRRLAGEPESALVASSASRPTIRTAVWPS
ncbi:MAG TPA: helix-turn-helix domain-containing protein [Kiloniellales bacterium]|nr:helix-turn-helix domain-containing protein [Kiloniellales bacterium]